MTTEQQTSTTVSLTTATTQAPVTTVPSNTPVSGSEMLLGIDTMPSNSPSHAHASATLGFLGASFCYGSGTVWRCCFSN